MFDLLTFRPAALIPKRVRSPGDFLVRESERGVHDAATLQHCRAVQLSGATRIA